MIWKEHFFIDRELEMETETKKGNKDLRVSGMKRNHPRGYVVSQRKRERESNNSILLVTIDWISPQNACLFHAQSYRLADVVIQKKCDDISHFKKKWMTYDENDRMLRELAGGLKGKQEFEGQKIKFSCSAFILLKSELRKGVTGEVVREKERGKWDQITSLGISKFQRAFKSFTRLRKSNFQLHLRYLTLRLALFVTETFSHACLILISKGKSWSNSYETCQRFLNVATKVVRKIKLPRFITGILFTFEALKRS